MEYRFFADPPPPPEPTLRIRFIDWAHPGENEVEPSIVCPFCLNMVDEVESSWRCSGCATPTHPTCVTKLQTSFQTSLNFHCGNCRPRYLPTEGGEKNHFKRFKLRLDPARNLLCPNDETVKLLLQLGAYVHVINYEKETPLFVAIKSNAIESVKMLLKAGSVISACCTRRETTLHAAARYAGLEIVKLLVENGVPVDPEDCLKQTPMVHAAARGHVPIMQYLHSKGAKLNLKIFDKRTLLHRTAWFGHYEATNWLLKQRMDPNSANREGWTPLHNAAVLGHVHIACLLIGHGARVNKRTVHQETALTIAKRFNRIEMMEFLHSKGGTD